MHSWNALLKAQVRGLSARGVDAIGACWKVEDDLGVRTGRGRPQVCVEEKSCARERHLFLGGGLEARGPHQCVQYTLVAEPRTAEEEETGLGSFRFPLLPRKP